MSEERADVVESVVMAGYSLLLVLALVLGSPWWVARMVFSAGSGRRYRAGLGQRLGLVPAGLRDAVRGRRVVWVHAVSVGEVLAATRLVEELGAELGAGWRIVVSTTTATGQALARERFAAGVGDAASGDVGAGRVFYYPLDFAWAVRAYLRVLKPELVVLMESEIWPRMLVECGRRGVPVAVVNARVSDRSYARGVKVRAVWGWVLRRVSLFLAQSEEDARRLVEMGARASSVKAIGNLKYDVRAAKESWVVKLIRQVAAGRPIVVAGSTVGSEGLRLDEERMILAAWRDEARMDWNAVLVLAPRHPERFEHVERISLEYRTFSASSLKMGARSEESFTETGLGGDGLPVEVIVLNTIGDLAAVYGVADVAFVGGSLVRRGGHNPLEPAQFGVPVVMGPSYENFRDVVGKMVAADGIRIVQDDVELAEALGELLADRDAASAMGKRGRVVFEAQSGATGRAVQALVGLVRRRGGAGCLDNGVMSAGHGVTQ
ncbi:MAG TPA: 3-deoxy-D-manno-octulosonic acid transferase [Acidobacteriaceae bacterium]|nr:3-deoxy-D-manno-octulosonic acid transferase [Acidobacteriaceae bacterium]